MMSILSDSDVDLSDNFVVICMVLTGQGHVYMIYPITNEY